MNKKQAVIIGLDIGVASVGWSILDKEYNILDLGSRLFPDAASPKDGELENVKRRSQRHMRRMLRRKKLRKHDLIKLFIACDLVNSEDEFYVFINSDICPKNPVEIKCKGLKTKLSKEELMVALFHYIQHRGFFYKDVDNEEIGKNQKDKINFEEILSKNEDKFPSEIQLELYKKSNYIVGNEINGAFSHNSWRLEIEKLFSNQEKSIQEWKDKYLEIFDRIRPFNVGPGSEKSRTIYGLYKPNDDTWYEKDELKKCNNKTHNYDDCDDFLIRPTNLWDLTVGRCSIFPHKKRGGKFSPIAEVFNLLNDLNTMKIENKYLTHEFKKMCFDHIVKQIKSNKSFNITPEVLRTLYEKYASKKISKEAFKSSSVFSGYRTKFKKTDKDPEIIITKLENTKILLTWMLENNLIAEIDLLNVECLKKINDLFCLIASTPHVEERVELLKKEYPNLSEKAWNDEKIVELKNAFATHSFSYNAMLKFIEGAQDKSENQMVFFKDSVVKNTREKFRGNDYSTTKYLPHNILKDEIISPTTKRAFTQALNVINAILKKVKKNDWEISDIIIEIPRDKNSKEERDGITNAQRKNEKFIKELIEKYNVQDKIPKKIKYKLRNKLKLWDEQDGYDIYTGKMIPLEDVLKEGIYEVDHILPHWTCCSNSLKYLTLTAKSNNHEKADRTPYQWLRTKGLYDENHYIKWVKEHVKNKDKQKIYLYQNDPKKDFVGFIEKNLVDTRNASRLILNLLQSFISLNKETYKNTKINVIRGAVTSFWRNKLNLKKDRDLNWHHAIDASLVAFIGTAFGNNNRTHNSIFYQYKQCLKNPDLIDEETGEIIKNNSVDDYLDEISNKALLDEELCKKITNSINQVIRQDKVKFSRMMIKKENQNFSNATIYSGKYLQDETKIKKLVKIDILNTKGIGKLEKLFGDDTKRIEKEYSSLTCYQQDKELYECLQKIWKKYKPTSERALKNSFVNYKNEYEKINDVTSNCIIVEKEPGNPSTHKWFVKKISKEEETKDIDEIIVLNRTNQKKTGFLDTLNPFYSRIYVNKKSKLVTVSINVNVMKLDKKNKKIVIDPIKLNHILSKSNVDIDAKYIDIFNGTTIICKKDWATNKYDIKEKTLFYFIGGGIPSQNKLEIKPLNFSTRKILTRQWIEEEWIEKNPNKLLSDIEEQQMQCPVSTIAKYFDLVQTDVLGNLYNRKSFAQALGISEKIVEKSKEPTISDDEE